MGNIAAIPPTDCLGKRIDLTQRKPECLANIAYGTLGPVSGYCRGQGGALAPIFAVNKLNYLFAALVFKIDIDIGRLIAAPGNEAREQNLNF